MALPSVPPSIKREIAPPRISSQLSAGFGADPFDRRMHATAGGPHTQAGVVAEVYVFCREWLRRETPDVLKELEKLT